MARGDQRRGRHEPGFQQAGATPEKYPQRNGKPARRAHKREGNMTQANPTQRELDQGRMRSVANNVILHLHPTRVAAPALRFSYTWGLGGISALLSTVLIVTGVLLMFRYEPTVERAYNSLQSLETTVAFGSLLRALHHWSANLLVVTLFLHLLRVFFTGGFKKGRGLNWTVGLILFILVLASNFTGYLLPWDQLAYWAVTVGTSLLAYIPAVGAELGRLALGGSEVGQRTLDNFFALHVAVLPLSLMGLLLYHFWRIRKDGGISQPPPEEGKRTRFVTTIPHLVQREAAAAAAVLADRSGLVDAVPRPAGAAGQPQPIPQSGKGGLVFPGPAGAAAASTSAGGHGAHRSGAGRAAVRAAPGPGQRRRGDLLPISTGASDRAARGGDGAVPGAAAHRRGRIPA